MLVKIPDGPWMCEGHATRELRTGRPSCVSLRSLQKDAESSSVRVNVLESGEITSHFHVPGHLDDGPNRGASSAAMTAAREDGSVVCPELMVSATPAPPVVAPFLTNGHEIMPILLK